MARNYVNRPATYSDVLSANPDSNPVTDCAEFSTLNCRVYDENGDRFIDSLFLLSSDGKGGLCAQNIAASLRKLCYQSG